MNPFKKLIDFIFPKRCIFCNIPIYSGKPYCEQCISLIPFAEDVCPVCAKNPCVCSRKESAFSAVAAVFFYELGAENAIRQLKFHERMRLRWQTIFIISWQNVIFIPNLIVSYRFL